MQNPEKLYTLSKAELTTLVAGVTSELTGEDVEICSKFAVVFMEDNFDAFIEAMAETRKRKEEAKKADESKRNGNREITAEMLRELLGI